MSTSSIEIIRSMFEQYIINKNKAFDSYYVEEEKYNTQTRVWGCITNGPAIYITYKNNGIKIKYHKRFTTHLGDSDTFIDRYVECDDDILLDSQYGF